jgi:hypothetical protein
MKQLGKIILLTLGFGVFAAALGQFNTGPKQVAAQSSGPPAGLNVNVVNTPLPVSGNVNAAVSGTVAVAPGTRVNISNRLDSNANPIPVFTRDLDNQFRQQPGLMNANSSISDGSVCQQSSFDLSKQNLGCINVPAGQRFITEVINAAASIPSGEKATLFQVTVAQTQSGNDVQNILLVRQDTGFDPTRGREAFIAEATAHLILDHSNTPFIEACRTSPMNNVNNFPGTVPFGIGLSGYFIAAPQQ